MLKVTIHQLRRRLIDPYINSNSFEAPIILTRNEVENGVTRTRQVKYFDCKPNMNSSVICGRYDE